MPDGPTLFDDEDGRDRNKDATSRPDADRGNDVAVGSVESRNGPNFLFRRAVVVGGVVAVVATASIVIGQLIGTGGSNTTSGAVSADWNRIVLIDERTGRVIVEDVDGEELSRIESGVRAATSSAVIDSTLVVAGETSVAVISISDETVDEFDLGADTVVTPAGSALTAIAPRPDGGRAVLVHGPSGDVIDTDTFAPVVGARYEFADARSSPSGRDVLVTDSGNFQSVLFSFDRDEPSFFPGLALAADDDLIVTAQNVGNDATVNVFNHDGDPITTGRTPSVRAGMITDGAVVLVTVEGGIVTMSSSKGETSDGPKLDIGAIESGNVTTTGDRLVVTGATGTALVGADATIIATFDGQRPTGARRPPTGSTCFTTASADGPEQQIAVIDLVDGTVLVEAAGVEPVLADASGCIVAAATARGFDVLGGGGVQKSETDETLLAISPDGLAVAAVRDRRAILVAISPTEPASSEPLDLGPRGRSVSFTQS